MVGMFIIAFLLGEMFGVIAAVIVSGKFDDFMEWRARKNDQKRKDPF